MTLGTTGTLPAVSRRGTLLAIIAFCAGLATGGFALPKTRNAEAERSPVLPPPTARHETTSGAVQTQEQQVRPEETSFDTGPLQRLINAVRISCEFNLGAGALWKNGRVTVGSAAWQGGPIMYDQITMADGTAMMLGSEGATGSNTGEVKVRAAATRTGLHFSSFVPRGDLISTTVFAALDEEQRFIAVMSTHATEFNHNSSQFHGVCDVLY
jgi:hypothetical protein